MSGSASIESARQKLGWAAHHLTSLETALQLFIGRSPYRIVIRDNEAAGQRQHVIAYARPLPWAIPLMVGDVIHNARTALDHLFYQLVLANNNVPDLHAVFPIWRDEGAFKRDWPGRAKSIGADARDVLHGLHPFKAGHPTLWPLHQLDIHDKHRLLLTVAAVNHGVILDTREMFRGLIHPDDPNQDTPSVKFALIPEERTEMKVGAVVFSAPLGDTSHDYVEFSIRTILDEPDVSAPEPIVPRLRELLDGTTAVVDDFAPMLS